MTFDTETAPREFLLAVEGLTVSFDGFKAVNDLSFYVDENEIRVIIGPNGAGKTAVLDLICGRTRATSGSIRFRGKELTRMKEHQIVHTGVGRKFQNPSIYEDLTVFANLEVSYPRGKDVWGALAFRRDAEVIGRVEEIAEMIFLKDQLDTEAAILSHGQKQWLEIGMLLHGARSCVTHMNRTKDRIGGWLDGLQSRMHVNKVTVALAAKMARMAWAIIVRPGAIYDRRDPAVA